MKEELLSKLNRPEEAKEKPEVPVAPSSHWNWVVSARYAVSFWPSVKYGPTYK